MASSIRRSLWVLAWFIALFIFNVASHWSQNAEKSGLYIFLDALSRLTTPLMLILSAGVVYGVLSNRAPKSTDAEPQTVKRRLFSRNILHTAITATMLASVVTWLLVAWSSRGGTKQAEKASVNPIALNNYALMAQSKADPGTEEDGLSPETKKRMREGFALQMAGGLQKQNNPLRVDITGDNHDVLLFQQPSMNEALANELIQEFGQDGANFWNGARLMNFSQIDFSGDNFKKIVTRQEIIGYGKDYEQYKAAFLKVAKGLQAGAQGELTKP